MSEKVCERCTATAKNGSRCRNRTCRGDKCWQHLKRDYLTKRLTTTPRAPPRAPPGGYQG